MTKHKQTGISFVSLIFIGAVLAFIGVVAAQVLPTIVEYQVIVKAIEKVKNAPTALDARTSFDKTAVIEDIRSIRGADLEITQDQGKMVLHFAYEREIHLAGPAYLTLKYAGRSK